MDIIKESMFGDPIAIYWIAAIFIVSLIGLWWNTRDVKFIKLLVIPVAIGTIGYICDISIVTDKEYIEDTTEKLADAFNRKDAKMILDNLSPSYRGVGRNISGITREISRVFRKYKNCTVKVREFSCDISNNIADCEITVKVTLNGMSFPMKCKMRWCKKEQSWKICGISKPTVVKF